MTLNRGVGGRNAHEKALAQIELQRLKCFKMTDKGTKWELELTPRALLGSSVFKAALCDEH